MFQRALICTDLADGLHRLVHFVPSLAAGGIKQIVFIHSVPLWQDGGIPRTDRKKVEQARERLSVALKSIPDGVEVKVEVPSGDSVDSIIEVARTYNSEVIFLGMMSQSLLTETLFGSTTMELVKRTSIPLLILRPQLVSAFMNEELDLRCRHLFRYLLIPYNDSTASKFVVETVKQYAQNQSTQTLKEIMLCWVVEEGGRRELEDFYKYQRQEAHDKLAAIKTELECLGLQVEIQVRQGNTIAEIAEVSLIFDISAIAISSSHTNQLLPLPIPSLTAELMRRSWHPVLFLPRPK